VADAKEAGRELELAMLAADEVTRLGQGEAADDRGFFGQAGVGLAAADPVKARFGEVVALPPVGAGGEGECDPACDR
jgi:hypothetical protein